MKIKLALLGVCFSLQVFAQYPEVNISGSQLRKITSKVAAGQEYDLHILLPAGYDKETKKYPVVYLMDSQWDFPLLKSIYGQQFFDGFIPELIIVGVTWGGDDANPDSLRARDYTPTNEKWMIQSGGADRFLDFIQQELFPFIETNYRAHAVQRTLMGCSLGGLFSVYTMFTHTSMFDGYIAASPALSWDNSVLYKYEKAFANKNLTHPVRLYLTVGDVERGKPTFEKFASSLSALPIKNILFRSKVLENTGHSGTKSETYSRGLQYVFEKPRIKLSNEALNRYAGRYELENGNKIELRNENSQLVIYLSPANKNVLFAASETSFYSTSEFFNVDFKKEKNKVSGFNLARFGSTQYLEKIY